MLRKENKGVVIERWVFIVMGENANINNNTDILTFAYGVHNSDRTVGFEWRHCCFDLHIVDVSRIIYVIIGHFGLLFPLVMQ